MWSATVFSLFPGMFPGPLGTSLAGEALARGVWSCEALDIRDHGLGRHRAVDDRPAGGGPGMVMRADVVAAALDAGLPPDDTRPRLLMSPRGVPLTQALVRTLVAGPGAVLVCGRFEGIDERVIAARHLAEVSIGDYVLSGGEMAALVLLDACVRLLPGVMGASASGTEESFEDGFLEYPHYTRPRDFEGQGIPDVLLGGNHAKIAAWRRAEAERATRERRPDLLAGFHDRDRPDTEPRSRQAPIGGRGQGSRDAREGSTAMGRDDTNEAHGPAFSTDFAVDAIGDTWISIRHRPYGHWWKFAVAEKNGRLQLVHDAHRAGEAAVSDIADFAIDAYDTATLEARRRGMVD